MEGGRRRAGSSLTEAKTPALRAECSADYRNDGHEADNKDASNVGIYPCSSTRCGARINLTLTVMNVRVLSLSLLFVAVLGG